MGTVYLAEQREPIRRRVALKVVKVGRDTAAVLARFDNERQALALMDHPNIAQIFDAGATATGRPYFVMEYIEGTPITQYWRSQADDDQGAARAVPRRLPCGPPCAPEARDPS
jgi:serine/threonine protein kinase